MRPFKQEEELNRRKAGENAPVQAKKTAKPSQKQAPLPTSLAIAAATSPFIQTSSPHRQISPALDK